MISEARNLGDEVKSSVCFVVFLIVLGLCFLKIF